MSAAMARHELGDPGTFSDGLIPTGPLLLGSFAAMMMVGGLIGVAVRAAKLSQHKRELRELQEAR